MQTKLKTILLVEDDTITAAIETKGLEQVGYRVVRADSGEAAMELIDKAGKHIDLILMDIDLGSGMDGTETAKKILENHDLPILFLSAHTEKEIVAKTETITNYGYVVKNSSFPVLDASIKMAFKLFDAQKTSRLKEQSLYESETRYRNLVENVNGIVYSYSTTRGALFWSPQTERILGFSSEDLVRNPSIWHDSIHPDDLPEVNSMIDGFAEGKSFKVEYRIKDSLGEWHWFLDQSTSRRDEGEEIIIYGTASDITRSKQDSKNLEDANKRLSGILEGTHAGTWEWNVQTGETVFNDVWAAILGYTLEELSPVSIKTWETLAHPGDLALSGALLERHFRGEIPYYDCECRMRHKDGRWVWVQDRGKVIEQDAEGKPLMMFGTHTDITERKMSEEKITKLLAEKDLILKEVHHRIKNNMNTMEGILKLQLLSQTNIKVIGTLQETIGRMVSMKVLYERLYRSNNFMELSLKDYLGSLVAEIIAIYSGKTAAKAELELEAVYLDAKTLSTLGIIVNELVTNSMTHAFGRSSDGIIRMGAKSDGKRLYLSYGDNGAGMPEDSPRAKSGGFGMQLIERLAEQLSGTFERARGAGEGTEFLLTFSL